jgi:hypothetical protein
VFVVVMSGFSAMTSVNEDKGKFLPPVGGEPGGIPYDADDGSFQVGFSDISTKERKSVDQTGLLVDDLRIVVFPARLVLLGSTMMVHGKELLIDPARGRPEIEGGLPAVGSDFQHGTYRTGPQAGPVESFALGIRHEPLDGSSSFEKFLRYFRRVVGKNHPIHETRSKILRVKLQVGTNKGEHEVQSEEWNHKKCLND